MECHMQELISLLAKKDRPDIQIITLENILGLTGTPEGLEIVCNSPQLLVLLTSLLKSTNSKVARSSSFILVNISAHEKGPNAILRIHDVDMPGLELHVADPIYTILHLILDHESHISDSCCMILSNITRPSQFIDIVIGLMQKSGVTFDQLINVFTKTKYSKKGQNLYYLGPVLSNLSQSPTVRHYILDKNRCVIQRLLPFTEYKESVVKRGGIVGTLRNCCFETDYHSWLLSSAVDILPRLLLPLAGSTEYDEEDNEKLPLELQYLPNDKVREEDPDIRCMLLEALTQLCAVRANREYVRNKNAYVILRELHKWEKDRKALLACENLVDILIRTEEEIGEVNLKDVVVPQNLQSTFEKMDYEFLKDV